jgi:hypothetical protein
MKKLILFILFQSLVFISGSLNAQNMVTYAGGSGVERFYSVLQLSNGTILVSGTAEDLNWVPSGVQKVQIGIDSIRSASAGKIGFIMQLSVNMKTILNVIHFPKGTVRDIYKMQTTNIAGQLTGSIYISGNRDVTSSADDGYYIAKLNNNFVNGTPSALLWAYNVFAGSGQHKALQPWDVGGDGKVVFTTGIEYDYNWASLERLTYAGKRDLVPEWPAHWSASGKEYDSTAATYSNTSDPLSYSAIVLKTGRNGSLRSKIQSDYSAVISDGNGGTKQGKYPDDYYFSGPCHSKACAGGPGYTGYKTSARPTQRVGAVVIDRISNDIYYGYSTQTVLPDGNPDFEPAIVAMDKNGKLKWWSRLYKESPSNSTPDQYIDGLAFDHTRKVLVVLARCHGNNTNNYWSGNTIPANSAANGFQNRFTGNVGNIHISWLGKLKALDGDLVNSTYVAEFPEGTNNYGAPLKNPNMASWPDPNGGWPNVNTTRCANTLSVGSDGSISIVGTGRRTMTTKNAFQKMPLPSSSAKGTWNYFVRTYTADLNRPLYSSLLTGKWDTLTGSGGGNIYLYGVCRVDSGVVVVGYHKADSAVASGYPMPTANIPSWGNNSAVNEQAVFAKLVSDSSVITGTNPIIQLKKQLATVYPNPVNSNEFYIDNPDQEKLKISIYSILGSELYSITETKNEIIIPAAKWMNGIYFVHITSLHQHTIEKIVIQK